MHKTSVMRDDTVAVRATNRSAGPLLVAGTIAFIGAFFARRELRPPAYLVGGCASRVSRVSPNPLDTRFAMQATWGRGATTGIQRFVTLAEDSTVSPRCQGSTCDG